MRDLHIKRILTGLSLGLLVASSSPVAFASPIAGTGAPLACTRTVKADGDPTNPFSYPFLADISKSLARSGFPASFFLGAEGARGPGIDLRTILLYETGILKTPVKLFVPEKRVKNPFPSLSVGSIPDSAGTMPDAPPVLSTRGSLEEASEGSTTNPGKKEQPSGLSLGLDMTKFSIDLGDARHKNEVTTKLSENVGSLAMVPPLGVELQPAGHDVDSHFRFWTVPMAVATPKGDSGTFKESSFVMMSPTGLKAIEGRVFFLTTGHMLASSQGQSIVVDTPCSRVTVEPGASAFVEVLSPGTTRVRVLVSKKGERNVGAKFKAEGKGEEIRLGENDDLLMGDHKLSDAEKDLQSNPSTATGGANWSKAAFSVKSLLDTNAFFSTSLSNQNLEQRQAVLWLKKQVR